MKALILLALFAVCYGAHVKMSNSPPDKKLTKSETPQFVMITYDDAVNVNNFYGTYNKLKNYKNKHNQCPIQATFFVSHENADYSMVNDLYIRGHEIAVHSISHKANVEYWKKGDKKLWSDEIAGMRKLLSKFAQIPIEDITGHRAPFLQSHGNITFQMLKDEGFQYDCSMPTFFYSKNPIFPYTLDDGYTQDCQIQPCPARGYTYPGLWLVPMVDYVKRRRISEDDEEPRYMDIPCAMADACLPYPETAEETLDYFKKNFLRHYEKNRAPFPMFLHEAWLSMSATRKEGYFKFIQWLSEKDDVFMVTIQEVLRWMENPQPLSTYKQTNCQKTKKDSTCSLPGNHCPYKKVPELGKNDKDFVICDVSCPTFYPWTNRPLGEN